MSPRPATSRGLAAAKAKALDGRGQHQEWLDLTEVSGPFLTMPVLLQAWPQLDSVDKDQRVRLRAHHADWQTDTAAGRDEWVAYVLRSLLEWGDALALRQGTAEDVPDLVLDRFTLDVPEHGARLRADFALVEPGADLASEPDAEAAAKQVRVLGMTVPSGTAPTARPSWGDEWSASPADRLARLLRHHHVPLGLLTDGRWWCLVWAPVGGVTTTAVFDAIGWNEAAERNVVRAFVSLLRRRRFFEYAEAETLVGLLKQSLDAGDEVTDALGVQVRQAVELLVDAIDRADGRAMTKGSPGLRASGVSAGEVYRGAVAVMMRVVFLLFAEERGLLPADNEVYAKSYSARFLRAELKARADAEGAAALEHTTAAWHRLIALFHAVHGGVDHPELKLPAYDGSIFDPQTYPWLETGAPLLPIDDRTVLHMLQAVQEVSVGSGRQRETRTLSFRALDVEQIGYVYEGLLSYDGERATDTMVGLIGPAGMEHEVPLRELESLAATSGGNVKTLAKKIYDKWKDPKPPASAAKLEKLLTPPKPEEAAEAKRRLSAVCRDAELVERLLPFHGLLRSDLRGLPVVIPAGALFVTESSLRKNTGTHYTPRSLAEEVVRHALEPLVYEPGPLQTANEAEWVPKTAQQILDLKVADIAMGSAAFLVAACRYLGDRLIEAWAREDRADAIAFRAGRTVDTVTAADAESDPLVISARRQIIEHCLYGVDINPMAVEMAKLSLWLVSMDPERPFTFLDDRLVAGDSLLGVTSLDQLKAVHLDVAKGDLIGSAADAERLVREVVELRHEITEKGDSPEALAEKRVLLGQIREKTARLRLVGDLVAGAALATCASGRVPWYEADGGERLRDLFPVAANAARRVVAAAEDSEVLGQARGRADEWLASELPDGSLRRVPVHWPLEFPEVFAERGGFDAVVGNPPFLGGQKLTGSMGEAYREYLVDHLARGKRGSADLVAYFTLRTRALTNSCGQTGLIATNTLAQGDTREVGLDQLADMGTEIRRAVKSKPWPSRSAVLEYCAVWTTNERVSTDAEYILGNAVAPNGISTALNPASRTASWGEPLFRSMKLAFKGTEVTGLGFTLLPDEAQVLVDSNQRNTEVIFPYLNGEDLNQNPGSRASRWIIDFLDRTEEQSSKYTECFQRIERLVKPERLANNNPKLREYWWRHKRIAPEMRRATAGLRQVIAITLVSKTVMPAMVANGQVFAHKLAVFASEDFALLAVLSSSPHYWWALDRSSTMKADLNYSPTDVFETLVRPPLTDRLRTAGVHLHEFGQELMLRRSIGLTATYNLVHDKTCHDEDIAELRRIHVEIDKATVEAYGWHDLLDESGATPPSDPTHVTVPLDHNFHETDQGPRYTIGLLARTEIIDRLRQLNHQAYADEVFLGLHKKPKKHPDMPPPSEEARRKKAEGVKKTGTVDFQDDGLFPPDDALF